MTASIQDHRTRRGAREVALAAIAERNAALRAEALRREERSRLTARNIVLGFRDAAREAWRLWGAR